MLIRQMLTSLSLAVWFMDDGSRKSLRHRTYIIHTLGYTESDLARLTQALDEKLGIEVKLHSQKETYWRLYIPSISAQKFKRLVEKYVKQIPSMEHKLVT